MIQLYWIPIFCIQVSIVQSWTLSNLLMSGTKATLGYADTVALGAQRGLDECREQFMWHKWNCPQTVFTQIFSKNNPLPTNRETAFVHAIISAGIVHTVTKNCSMGQFEQCRCDGRRGSRVRLESMTSGHSLNGHSTTGSHSMTTEQNSTNDNGHQETLGHEPASIFRDNYRWGGCSDNVDFGFELAKSFLDEREVGHDSKAIINLHNNLVGRLAVKNTMKKICKCHGVSGSCTTQTCWMKVGEFKEVGNYLKQAYNRAIKVTGSSFIGNALNGRVKKAINTDPASDNESSSSSEEELITLRRQVWGQLEPDPTEGVRDEKFGAGNSNDLNAVNERESGFPINRLIFSEESPDYCVANSTLASKGTLGRTCSRRKGKDVSSEERRSCRTLCKKCGFKVKKSRKRVIKTCNCKFKWCCQVECESCAKEEVTLTCALY